jgi:putative hydrolase of the HAD superfamily
MWPIMGVDADDTLWENEERFHEVERLFRDLMAPWADGDATDSALLATEQINIARHGYGIKGFVLSMVLTAVELSDGAIDSPALAGIVGWGHDMMAHPIELLDGVPEALDVLGSTHQLLLVTKGDLGDQLGKLRRSGLADRFWRVEVVPEKDEQTYREVLDRHGIDPADFTMVGNSVKSDVLPVLAIGGRAIHVPHTTTWVFEEPDPDELAGVDFPVVDHLDQVAALLTG